MLQRGHRRRGVTRRTHAHVAKAAPLRPAETPPAKSDKVSLEGTLYDEDKGTPVAAVKLVLLGPTGEIAATTGADGSFAFQIPPGRYRVFVRDLDWITSGLQERVRIDDGPHAGLAGGLDAKLAPVLVAETDLDHLELTASRGAKVTGRVYDEHGNRVAGALVRMLQEAPRRASQGDTSFLRPVLGTDTVVTNEDGDYLLTVPAGIYAVEMRHPNYGGVLGNSPGLNVNAGQHQVQNLQAVRGCIIRGKVVLADGKTPSPDGAVEVDTTGGQSFGPQARVAFDGTFEFASIGGGIFRMRAWPWRSAPSSAQEIHCEDQQIEHVTLTLGDRPPDLAGTLTDAQGNAVPFNYLDLRPNDPNDTGQQERSDAAGVWHIYDVTPGNYRIVGAAEGRGIVDTTVAAPKTDIRLQLSGTGRISGTTTQLVDGSILVAFLQCGTGDNAIDVPPEMQIVPVHGGRFTIDNAPACTLRFHARWRSRTTEATAVVEPKGTTYVTLDLGEPRQKAVNGTVVDENGAPAANVPVTALVDEREAATVRTDKNGRFTITTRSGAQLLARGSGKLGKGSVGKANVASERVDIVLDTNQIDEP